MRLFIHIEYDGSHFSGWQRQKKTSNTIQESIENTLLNLFKKEIVVYGCGRTDTGVHASKYILHINLDQLPEFDLKLRMNQNLPDSIAVHEIIQVAGDQHCRYDALARSYDYFIHWKKDPFLTRYSLYYDHAELDIDLMKKAALLILHTKDFRPLCKQPDLHNHTICHVSNCALFIDEEAGRLRFTITSNRFLRGMVRYCVYFLLKVGSGALTLSAFDQILNQEISEFKKRRVQPRGLFLTEVAYPFVKFQNGFINKMKIGLEV